MRVRIDVTLDVDEQEWAEEYGLDVPQVRADVREHVRNALAEMPVAPRSVVLR